jgi:hypothetical protein
MLNQIDTKMMIAKTIFSNSFFNRIFMYHSFPDCAKVCGVVLICCVRQEKVFGFQTIAILIKRGRNSCFPHCIWFSFYLKANCHSIDETKSEATYSIFSNFKTGFLISDLFPKREERR